MTMVVARGTPAEFVDTSGVDAGAVRTFSLAGYTNPTVGDVVMFVWNSNASGDWAASVHVSPGATVEGGPYGAVGNIGEDVFLTREYTLTSAEITANQVTQWLPSNFHPHTLYMLLYGNADAKAPIDVIGNTTNAASPGGSSPETFTFKDITPGVPNCYVTAFQGIGAAQTPSSWGSTPGGWTLLKASTSQDGCYFIGQQQTAATAIGALTIQCTGPTLQGTNATSWSVKPVASAYMDIEHVGVGALAVSTSSGGSLAPTAPTGQQAGDFLICYLEGRPTDTSEPSLPTGWVKAGTDLKEVGANDLRISIYYKVSADTTADVPTFTVPANWSGTSAGMIVWQGAWRNVDKANPMDAAAVFSDAAAAATLAPAGITTVTEKAHVLSFVATADDNTLTIPAGTSLAQGFKALASGASYQTTTGGDCAGGLAFRCIRTAGAVTCPTWTETANGNDVWAYATIALRPAPRQVNRALAHSAAIGRAATI